MSGSVKLGLLIIGLVLLGGMLLKFTLSLIAWLTPILIVAAIGLILFGVASKKALGGTRRRYLP
ncbi:MAG: hypothetical protein IT363_11555 [Methanoregulaceae archaeon]|jgi:hypothetical protein|nr:hypothetical protein [Methanoregulaceae archaeon]